MLVDGAFAFHVKLLKLKDRSKRIVLLVLMSFCLVCRLLNFSLKLSLSGSVIICIVHLGRVCLA